MHNTFADAYDRLAPVWSKATDEGRPFNGFSSDQRYVPLGSRPLTGV